MVWDHRLHVPVVIELDSVVTATSRADRSRTYPRRTVEFLNEEELRGKLGSMKEAIAEKEKELEIEWK